MDTPHPLQGRVALVAGATRGAGRGIARALGEAGAVVYCTGRSVGGHPSAYGRPETVEETAELIAAAGGTAVAIRVDHTVERDVEALCARIHEERGRLDVLVNSIAGEDPSLRQWDWFWNAKLEAGEAAFRQCLLSHIITAKHAARLMIRARTGLIVEVTESDTLGAGGNPLAQVVKLGLKGLALSMAAQLMPYNVAAVAVTPGFLRSESMLERMGVSESNWRDGGKKDRNFLESESPLFIGRGVAALAADPQVLERSGLLVSSWELARDYRFTDADGRRPDWGSVDIDLSQLPPALVEYLRTGARLHLEWLRRVTERTGRFLTQLSASA